MNKEFFDRVLQNPPKSYSDAIFEDKDNIIWVDWREAEDSIVESVSEKLGTNLLVCQIVEIDTPAGYEAIISYGQKVAKVKCIEGRSTQHDTLAAIADLLGKEFELRHVSDTNGTDGAGIVVGAAAEWRRLASEYGRRLDEHFVPVSALPDLFNTAGNELDEAIESYARRND